MDWSSLNWSSFITDIIVIVGFIITGCFQHKKIDALKQNIHSLEGTISAQDNLIRDMEKAVKIIDVEKYGKHIRTFEDLVERNAQKTIEAMKKEFDEQQTGITTKFKHLMEKTIDLLRMVGISLLYVHPSQREQLVIDNMKVPFLRDAFLQPIDIMKSSWIGPPDLGLSAVLTLVALQKQKESGE